MIKWVLHKLTSRFERAAHYDAAYLHDMIDISAGAGLRYFTLPLLSQMHGPAPCVWAGAALASVLDGDCGPCAQLVIDSAVKAGVSPDLLRACVRRDFAKAGPAGLGFRFTEAAIRGDPEVENLRAEIERCHGSLAVISAAYAAAASRAYPVLKRALGHGSACQKLRIGERVELVVRAAA